MSKKAEFMEFINKMNSYNEPTKIMINFLTEVIELSLTEERVTSIEFLNQMIKLTDKYIEMCEDNK